MKWTTKEFALFFDHAVLQPFSTREQVEKTCAEAVENGFKMVAVNSVQVGLCRTLLEGSGVLTGAGIAFPFGQTTLEAKEFETQMAIAEGAEEIDYVLHIGKVKEQEYAYIQKEMDRMVSLCRARGVTSKVIFETCYLTDTEIHEVAAIAQKIRPDFIKTSTGFGKAGATVHHMRLMKEVVGDEVKVKASGGIRDLDTCLALIEAGAQRIGSSSSVAILEDYGKRLRSEYK